ncbi:MAG: hypothetical protein J6C96_00500 [Oscillospiraceae bacterium]|nr:hypothetical protein [Oscillospiraceae bacterium]
MATVKKIPLRTHLDFSIFTEMEEKFPPISDRGVELRQNMDFFSMPTGFDFCTFSDFCIDNNIDVCKSFSVLIYLTLQMCNTYGYYLIGSRSFFRTMCLQLDIDKDEFDVILSKLVEGCYIYVFDDKYSNVYAVRTFETVQSSRASRRHYKNKDKEEPKEEPKEETEETEETEEVQFFGPDDVPPPDFLEDIELF